MRPKPWIGLLAAGPVSPPLYRLSNWNAILGPVCAETLRVASRLANRMKGGFAARADALAAVPLILVSGPDAGIAALVRLGTDSSVDWTGKTVLLVDTALPIDALSPFSRRSALVGKLRFLEAFDTPHFFADAGPAAQKFITRLASETKSRHLPGRAGGLPAFEAGLAMVGSLFAPLYAASVEALKLSGLTQNESLAVAERVTADTLRSWRKAGRKAWDGTIEPPSIAAIREHAGALGVSGVALGAFLEAAATLGESLYQSVTEHNRENVGQ